MKRLIPFIALILLVASCQKEVKKNSTPAIRDTPLNERPIPPLPGTATSNSVIGGPHYICPKNCVGGNGPTEGKCPVCETEMAHNQGFHVGQNNANTSNSTAPNSPNPAASTGDLPNANGQYHYTCTKGCAGGKGKAGNCANCGETLEHNTAFHS